MKNSFTAFLSSLKPKRLAIAVSGGADSMALLLMAQDWAQKNGTEIFALTVDHGLRKESKREAQQVQDWCKKLGIPHHTLKISGTIKNKVQEQARAKRYQLMTAWCKKHKVNHLLTAHHRGDQAETLFFRLARGSNLRGLACILPVSKMHGVTIVRPLLNISKKQLIAFLQKSNQGWVEDPSNQKTAYTRNALRMQLQSLPNADAIEKRAADIADFFTKWRTLMDKQIAAAMQKTVRRKKTGAVLDHAAYASLPPIIAREILAKLICELTGSDHPPRTQKLERLCSWLLDPKPNHATLAHLRFEYNKKQGIITILSAASP